MQHLCCGLYCVLGCCSMFVHLVVLCVFMTHFPKAAHWWRCFPNSRFFQGTVCLPLTVVHHRLLGRPISTALCQCWRIQIHRSKKHSDMAAYLYGFHESTWNFQTASMSLSHRHCFFFFFFVRLKQKETQKQDTWKRRKRSLWFT